jgi:hypothetical protein
MAKSTPTPTTTFTWAIANMDRQLSDGAVTTVHYTVSAHDGTYSAGAYGSIGLPEPDPDAMIPFADLTPETCVQWVKASFGPEKVAEIEIALQQQLDLQRQPVTGQGLPWAN